MEVVFTVDAIKDLKHWKKKNDAAIEHRINELLADICEHPFSGIGNPEALKYELSNYWSRRINKEHRLVYQLIDDTTIEVVSLRFHY